MAVKRPGRTQASPFWRFPPREQQVPGSDQVICVTALQTQGEVQVQLLNDVVNLETSTRTRAPASGGLVYLCSHPQFPDVKEGRKEGKEILTTPNLLSFVFLRIGTFHAIV